MSLYDIKFVITDKSGNKFFESPRCNTNYVCEWNDVPQDVMKLIESDEIDSSVTEVYLEYGKIEDFSVKGNRSYLKNLPELKIETLAFRLAGTNAEISKIHREIDEEKQRNAEEFRINKEQKELEKKGFVYKNSGQKKELPSEIQKMFDDIKNDMLTNSN